MKRDIKNLWRILFSLLLAIILGSWTGKANARFGSKTRSKITKNAVMITNRGVILLNNVVVKKYLKEYNYVNLDFNYAKNRLAIKPVKNPSKNSVVIHRTRKGKVAILIKKGFLKNAGADIRVKKYFECTWNAIKRVIVVNFGIPVTRSMLK